MNFKYNLMIVNDQVEIKKLSSLMNEIIEKSL